MPEGPECRIFTDNLIKEFNEQSINSINIISGRYLKEPIKNFNTITYPLKNIKFNCKGKFLFWTSNYSDINLCFVLGMTGAFSSQQVKHSAIKIKFDNGDLFFNDPRRFGTFRILSDKELREKLSSLGWDILQENIPNNIVDRIKKFSHKTIAEVLMDQKIQSGIGNYIKCEACYAARILPTRLISSLNGDEVNFLYEEIKKIAEHSYSEGGATIKTFANMYGNTGKFFDTFQVYGKKFDTFGNTVSRVLTKDNRSTYLVENLQK